VNPNKKFNDRLLFNNLIQSKNSSQFPRIGLILLILTALSLACSLASPAASPPIYPIEPGGAALDEAGSTSIPVGMIISSLTPVFPDLPSASQTDEPSPTETPETTSTAVPEPELTPVPTLNPYAGLSINHLSGRTYGGGNLEIRQVMNENSYFTRYLVVYPSDGLLIYGFMNVPRRGEGPYPVVIALHGYVDPAVYNTLDYTTGYADTLARAGFLVLHPNLRNYPPSDQGDNLFRVGMAVDVLNLIALVKQQGGTPGPLAEAIPGASGLWGHSMGGGISLRAAVVDPDIKAVVLYGAMSGDERQNFEAINRWSEGQRGQDELAVPIEELGAISPINFLDRLQASLSIHHGESDQLVPVQWSLDLCYKLAEAGKVHECVTYPGQPHTFNENGNQDFMQRVIEFFKRELK
jgi:uncharacterized protein